MLGRVLNTFLVLLNFSGRPFFKNIGSAKFDSFNSSVRLIKATIQPCLNWWLTLHWKIRLQPSWDCYHVIWCYYDLNAFMTVTIFNCNLGFRCLIVSNSWFNLILITYGYVELVTHIWVNKIWHTELKIYFEITYMTEYAT